jgi:hypothetical protein
MHESNGNIEGAREIKATLITKIDERVIPALDRIANTNQVNTSQFMSRFLNDVADIVEFVEAARGGAFKTIEDRLARLITERCHEATPEALRTMGRIWDRAAELKEQEGGAKG